MIWGIVGIAAFIIEWVTVGNLISIWFCAGAFAAWIAMMCKAAMWLQVTIFVVISICAMLIVRPLAAKYLRGNIVATTQDRVIGEKVGVTKYITPTSWGEVKANGAIWSAKEVNDEPVSAGEFVRVTAIEGAKLLVKKLNA